MGWREWTGVGERRWKTAPDEHVQPAKTLWDWLQLLIVPAILIGITFAWSALQSRSDNARDEGRIAADNMREDRRIEADRDAAEQVRQDTTLSAYFQQMSDLVLHENLRSSKNRLDPVRSVARTVTLAALRRLNEERRGELVRFLQEARLIHAYGKSRRQSQVSLRGANLTGVKLGGANLTDANFVRANLTGAKLTGAKLERANLTGANLTGADLTRADLTDADLTDADFTGADFTGATLIGVKRKGAKGLPQGNR